MFDKLAETKFKRKERKKKQENDHETSILMQLKDDISPPEISDLNFFFIISSELKISEQNVLCAPLHISGMLVHIYRHKVVSMN